MDPGSPDKSPEGNIEENGALFAENLTELHGDTSVQEQESLGSENEAAGAVLQFETNMEHIGSSILPIMCDEGVPPSIVTSDLPGSSPPSKRFGKTGLSIMSDLEHESIGITTDYTAEEQRSVLEDYQTENKKEWCDIGLSDIGSSILPIMCDEGVPPSTVTSDLPGSSPPSKMFGKTGLSIMSDLERESIGRTTDYTAEEQRSVLEDYQTENKKERCDIGLSDIGSSILPIMCDEGVPTATVTSDLPGSSPPSKMFGKTGLSIMSDLEHESIGITTDYTAEEQRSVLEDYQTENKKERCDIGLSGDPLDGSINKIINTEAETESSNPHSPNHLITIDNQNSGVVDNEDFSCQAGKSPTFSEETNGDVRNIVENTQSEKTEIVMEEVDNGNYGNNTAKEYYDRSGMVTSGNGGIGSQNMQNASSPERQLSIPPPMSPQTQPSTVQEEWVTPANSDRKAAPSPSPSKRKRSPSPEKQRVDRKRTSTSDHLSPSVRQKSLSERTPPRDSHHKDSTRKRSASPRRRQSPRRRDRSVSRSPTRRRDSSGFRRDHRGRSRSRSPYGRDRSRRSPRRRPSPRRRSPPNYHSHRRSPRRPWAPPARRNPGIGKPGNNLFVAGFSYVTTERDLERKFSRYGRVTDVRIVRDKSTGDSRGFGFLSLESDEDADAAIRALDQTEWNGRIVLVEKSKTPLR